MASRRRSSVLDMRRRSSQNPRTPTSSSILIQGFRSILSSTSSVYYTPVAEPPSSPEQDPVSPSGSTSLPADDDDTFSTPTPSLIERRGSYSLASPHFEVNVIPPTPEVDETTADVIKDSSSLSRDQILSPRCQRYNGNRVCHYVLSL